MTFTKISEYCFFVFFVSAFFFAFISPALDELSLVKKVFSYSFSVFLFSVVVLVFLPSKEFVCGA